MMGKHSLRDFRERTQQKRYDILEKDSLKYSKGEVITRKVYQQDLDEFLARGWTIISTVSNGLSGSIIHIMTISRTELEVKYA